MKEWILYLALASHPGPAEPVGRQVGQLAVGEPAWFSVALGAPAVVRDSPTQELRLASQSDGKVTIDAGSFDFDVLLRVETESGEVLGEDDDGGVGTNARLVVELRRGRTYQVLVATKSGGSGWFWVDCEPGERPEIPRTSSLAAAVVFHGGTADRALARGDRHAAATHLERKASLRIQLSQFEEARAALESARSLWGEAGEKKRAADATLELGRIACKMRDFKGCEELYSQALSAYRALGDVPGEARTLLASADARAAAEDPDAAARYAEALAASKKAGDAETESLSLTAIADLSRARGDRRAELQAIAELGDRCRARRDLEKARDRHRQASKLAGELGDHVAEAAAASDLGEDWLLGSEWTQARECFENALRIARENGDESAQAEALDGLGRVSFGMRDYGKALTFHEQQLDVGAGDAVQAREARLRMGMCRLALRDYVGARTLLESEVQSAHAAGERRAESVALRYLSIAEMQTGATEKSVEHRELARELRRGSERDELDLQLLTGAELLDEERLADARETLRGCLEAVRARGDLGLLAEVLLMLGESNEGLGRHAEAVRCSSEVVDLSRQIGNRWDEGEGLERLGVQYRAVGALDTGRERLEEALAIARELGDAWQEMDALNNIANVWGDLDEYDKALEIYAQAGELARQLNHPIAGVVILNNMGVVHWDCERYEESRRLLEPAVQSAMELGAPAYLAESRGNLARVLRKLGDRDRAAELANQSLESLGAPDAIDPRKSLIPLSALAGLAMEDGDVARALPLLERAARVLEGARREAQATPDDVCVNPWLLFPPWDRHAQDLIHLLDLEKAGNPGEGAQVLADGFREADRSRARQLASGIAQHRRGVRSKDALSFRDAWTQSLAQLTEKRKEVARAIRDRRPSQEVERLQEEVLALGKKAEELELALQASSPREAALDLPVGVDPSAVRAAGMTSGCTLIEYAEGDEDLYAYVVTEKQVSLLGLGKRKVVDSAVERYLGLIGSRSELPKVAEIAQAGRNLFDLLLARPLEAAGGLTPRLLVVPTPALAVLPFDALVVSAGPQVHGFGDLRFVIDMCEVDYGPSASILVRLAAEPRILSGKMLVLADPFYPSEEEHPGAMPRTQAASALLSEPRGSSEPRELRRLKKTREEALALADILVDSKEADALARLSELRQDRSGSLHAEKLDLYLGSEASNARLAGDLQPYKILHLAAHGWVDGHSPRKTGLALAWTGSGDYRGFFTIADAAGLDLNANLVVLSACDTARGKIHAGEGVESLACAFLQAGARSVVASLWQVDDQVAAETVKSLYAGMSQGQKPAEALHAAKLAIRRGSPVRGMSPIDGAPRNEGHPYLWAPFVHIGVPR